MNILIICRYDDPKAVLFSKELSKFLSNRGNILFICNRNLKNYEEQIFSVTEKPEMVIIIGGDGTILLTVQRMPVQVPIVGINYGEVGFLADLEPHDAFDFFEKLISPVKTEPRMRISFRYEGKCVGTALNEAVIITDRPAKMLKFLIYISGKIAEQFRADGLIISTPTGSTAYAMSSGGPIVDPRIEGFLLVPLAPFMLSNRPHLIDSGRSVSVTLETDKAARLVIDGQIEIHLKPYSIIELEKSDEPALFLDAGVNFFEKINRKLRHL